MIEVLIVLGFAFIGGGLSRMHGGGWPNLPWSLDAWLYAIPYGLACYMYGVLALGPYIAAVLAKRSGHGGWMDLGTWKREREDETLEFLIKRFKKHLSPYWYDALGLALSGLSVSFLSGCFLAVYNPAVGLCVVLSGLTKAPAYMIGWKISDTHATEIGEFLTGFAAWGALALIFFMFS